MLKPCLILLTLLSLLLFTSRADTLPAAALAFTDEQQVLPTLSALQQNAVAEQKLLLLVLGSGWCHDSEALLKQFNQPAFAAQLQQRFNIALVDVGYLQYGQAVTQRYQLPLYYGTPTVMVINPATGQLLNKADLMHWTNAASHSATDYQQYFMQQDFLATAAQQPDIAPALMQQINQFERQQADKLALAYQHLGPLLAGFESSDTMPDNAFRRSWNEVAAFRSAIIPAVQQLQQQAATLPADGQLQLPVYPPFSFSKQ
ncbi:hypothetical protein [Rheinheimera maricola]|uniref:Thioredoxin family protein n=1 Tax=Rheinheimera maricola TaxID=2793282 RepID=A0ABS7X7X4_9GAMM|nr:hypothetical protein [Rheinheimera maricola]MBZ9611648.1 hypothetical protein [Rheinheimera maricola]